VHAGTVTLVVDWLVVAGASLAAAGASLQASQALAVYKDLVNRLQLGDLLGALNNLAQASSEILLFPIGLWRIVQALFAYFAALKQLNSRAQDIAASSPTEARRLGELTRAFYGWVLVVGAAFVGLIATIVHLIYDYQGTSVPTGMPH
jgi:hypothetical protein